MTAEIRNGNVVLTLGPEEAESYIVDIAAGPVPALPLPDEFWPLAREAVEKWRARLDAERRRKALAAQAAEACPIKVGQEVRDPNAWRNARTWWRVTSVDGTPDRPWLDTRIVKADGKSGDKQRTFYGTERLEVRDNTEGSPAPRLLPGVPLKAIANRINSHLVSMEAAQPRKSIEPDRRLYNAGAFPAGSRVSVRYVSYQSTWHLTRDEAAEYLIRLDAGFRGRHHDRSQPAGEAK